MIQGSRIAGAASLTLLLLAITSSAQDYVILKDGTILQGRIFREKETIKDFRGDVMVKIDKSNGLQGIDVGPKQIFFSSLGAQIGEQGSDPALQKKYKEYRRDVKLLGTNTLPGGLALSALDFDANWKAEFKVTLPGNQWTMIRLQVNYIDPKAIMVVSSSHNWFFCFDTQEVGPQYCRKLLVTHPELADPPGKVDPLRRIAIARFMTDAGWLDAARAELDLLKKDHPQELPKDASEKADQLRAEADQAMARLNCEEAENAVTAGRYTAAAAAIARFKPEHADAKLATRVAAAKATIDGIKPKADRASFLIRSLRDELTGRSGRSELAAVGGSLTVAASSARLDEESSMIAAAADVILSELHPDAISRLDLFLSLAEQTEQERKAGRSPSRKPAELLALAITGWLKGKNGASAELATAVRCWRARELLVAHQNEPLANDRAKRIGAYLKSGQQAAFDELAQIISLLPPADPLDPAAPGTPIPAAGPIVSGLFERNTGSLPDRGAGIDYVLRLPTEYHHGRAYPVVLVLAPPGVVPAEVVSRLAPEADRHGYILAAPNWSVTLTKSTNYNYSGEQHFTVTATLRDLYRRLHVDPDRVFLYGLADGANFALDLAAGHPDLFAGVAAFGPTPKYNQYFMYYWSNFQKVPVYAVTGSKASESFKALYPMFGSMLKQGFPSMLTIYKGRSVEYYSAEFAPLFTWFDRKRRPPTATVVKPEKGQMPHWLTMRTTDTRFYWVEAVEIAPVNLFSTNRDTNTPASIDPDIRGSNGINIRTRGIRKIAILFERDIIDWTKPITLQINGNTPTGFRPKILEPDLSIMLDEFYRTGDRKRLILQKLTFPAY